MTEQRRASRFDIHLPLRLIRAGLQELSETAETHNMSSSGVLFTNVTPLPVGEPVEYLITLPPGEAAGKPVTLRCLGKVVRHQRAGHGPSTTAVTLERYEFVRDNGSKR